MHSHLVLKYDCPPSHSYTCTYKTSYPTRLRACGGCAERPQIRPKSPGLDMLKNVNDSEVRKLAIHSNSVSYAGKRPKGLCHLVLAALREVIVFVGLVNIPNILSVVCHLLVFITAGNLNMSNGNRDRCMHVIQILMIVGIVCVWACEASLQCWINQRKFHSPQTQLTRRRILPFRLSVGDMIYMMI